MERLRIGIVGDLHGNPLPLLHWIDVTKVDAVIQLGDFQCYDQEFPIPVYWVHGNKEYVPAIKERIPGTKENLKNKKGFPKNNIMLVNGSQYFICGLSVVGIGGAEAPKGDGYITNFDKIIDETINKFSSGDIDIFVSHEPCANIVTTSDYDYKICNTANPKLLMTIIPAIQPKYAFGGHWHRNVNKREYDTDCFIVGTEPRDWLIFDVNKYKDGEYPISNMITEARDGIPWD